MSYVESTSRAGRILGTLFVVLGLGAIVVVAQNPTKRDGDLPPGALRRIVGHTGGVYDVVFSPDGRRLYSRGLDEEEDKTLRVWDVASGNQLHAIQGLYRPVALSRNGKTLILGGPDQEVLLWDTDDLKRPRATVAAKLVKALRVRPDGKSFVIVHNLGTTEYVDLATGKITKTAPGGRHSTPLAFSPDGEILAYTRSTGSNPSLANPRIHFCEAESGKDLPGLLAGRQERIMAASFSPDGRWLAASGTGPLIHVWEVASPQGLIWTLKGHEALPGQRSARVWCLAFSPDGRFLISGGLDRTARVWDLLTGEEVAVLHGHTGNLTALGFSRDGSRLATGGGDRVIVLWDFWDVALGRPASGQLSDAELKDLWTGLGSGPTAKHQLAAVGVLSGAADQAVKLVKEKMATYVAEAQLERILELIKQLDDDRYPVRKQATLVLMRLKKNAEPVLRKALQEAESLEVRFRLRMILSQGGSGPSLAEDEIRRYRRVVLLLQRIGTPAARELLEQLATVFPDRAVQRDAQKTLALLDQRK